MKKNNLGQHFITGIPGTSLDKETANFLKKAQIGGIILFAHNFEDPAQLAEMINDLKGLAGDYPFWVSVDHEGGRVWRFKKQFHHFPAMGDIAKLDSPKLVFQLHQIMGEELKGCGLNLCFAPCCDILTNPKNRVIGDRAFGSSPDVVSKFVSAGIRGLQTAGVAACAKHFPGHGDTSKDSHFDLPVVKTSKEVLLGREVIPFVKASRSKVDMMMTSHLLVDALDPENPVTLSPSGIRFLREQTRFQKVVISDDLNMQAISDKYSPAEASILSLVSGCDMVIFRDLESTVSAYEGLQLSYQDGGLNHASFSEKLSRILELKKSCKLSSEPVYIPSISQTFSKKENQDFFAGLMQKLEANCA